MAGPINLLAAFKATDLALKTSGDFAELRRSISEHEAVTERINNKCSVACKKFDDWVALCSQFPSTPDILLVVGHSKDRILELLNTIDERVVQRTKLMRVDNEKNSTEPAAVEYATDEIYKMLTELLELTLPRSLQGETGSNNTSTGNDVGLGIPRRDDAGDIDEARVYDTSSTSSNTRRNPSRIASAPATWDQVPGRIHLYDDSRTFMGDFVETDGEQDLARLPQPQSRHFDLIEAGGRSISVIGNTYARGATLRTLLDRTDSSGLGQDAGQSRPQSFRASFPWPEDIRGVRDHWAYARQEQR